MSRLLWPAVIAVLLLAGCTGTSQTTSAPQPAVAVMSRTVSSLPTTVHGTDGAEVTVTDTSRIVCLQGGIHPDFDGDFEDANGNNRLDFADVVLVFSSLDWIAANTSIGPFDFNGNGRTDFADVVTLFSEIGSG